MRRLTELTDAAAFSERALRFLTTHEAENNLLLSSALVLARSAARSPRLSFYVVEENENVTCAALNSSERRLLISQSSDEDVRFFATGLADRLAGRLNKGPGDGPRPHPVRAVLGPGQTARCFCETFLGLHTPLREPRHLQKILKLDALSDYTPRHGHMRTATARDIGLLLKWSHAFVAECRVDEKPEETTEMVHRYLENRQFSIWDDGRPSAMAGFGGITPRGARVNMVYTDPELRGRGYAGSLVYTLSRKLLAAGHRACFLFADQLNPTASRIYEKIGYHTVSDFSEYNLT